MAACVGLGAHLLTAPATAAATLPAEKPHRVLVDRAAGAEDNQSDQPLRGDPVDDPKPSDSKTVQPREIVAKLLPRSGILADDVEARPNLALEARMKTPDEILDGLWNAKAVDDPRQSSGISSSRV